MIRPTLSPPDRTRLPRRTIRLRLTLLYGALFLVSGAALLTGTYLLVERQYTANGARLFVSSTVRGGTIVHVSGTGGGPKAGSPGPAFPTQDQLTAQAQAHSSAALSQLLVASGIALALMAVLSIWLGWLVAGRALRPLRTMTNAAREISASSLHRRLALDGPDDEISQLGETFNQLLGRLEASFEAQRQFAANASHELRTPLTLERTIVEVALADRDASVESLRQMGRRVLAAGEQQEHLIEALLTLSRSQRGLDRHELIDLAATAAGALHELDAGELTVVTGLQPALTRGDPRLVERLIANLLANAVVHNVPQGRVEVRTETRDGRALLTIENTGPPIPLDQLDRLFLPFQRLDQARTHSSSGFGLGLSIVRAIAAAHSATISATASPGGGLRIEVGFAASEPPIRTRSSALSRVPATGRP